MTKVFVYGTLKKGHGNNYLLEKATFIGAGQTTRVYRLLDSGFPVLWPRAHVRTDPRNAPVRGEVYEADDETVARLDRLESEGRMYHRKVRRVRLDSGTIVNAHLYIGSAAYWRSRKHNYPAPNGAYDWPCRRQEAAE